MEATETEIKTEQAREETPLEAFASICTVLVIGLFALTFIFFIGKKDRNKGMTERPTSDKVEEAIGKFGGSIIGVSLKAGAEKRTEEALASNTQQECSLGSAPSPRGHKRHARSSPRIQASNPSVTRRALAGIRQRSILNFQGNGKGKEIV